MRPASAQIETAPSNELPIKVNGPLLITGYSFSGHSINYIQIFNSSTSIVDLSGWKVAYEYGGARYNLIDLYGNLAPKQYITVAKSSVLPSATFIFTGATPVDPILTSVVLVPPTVSNLNDEIVSPSITSSTVRVAGTPATFYFTRTTSSATGNYTTTFNAFIPPASFIVASDGLYVPPASFDATIVEIFPDAPSCAPTGTASCSDYVKIFNGTNQPVDLSKFRLRAGSYGQTSTSSNTAQLSGVLQSGEYASFPISLSSSGSWVWLEDTYGILRYDSSIVGYPSSSGHDSEAWSYNQSSSVWEWTTFPSPGNVANQFAVPVEVNMCEGLVVSEIAANVASEDQFIEIMNTTDMDLLLDGCVIQTNRSTTNNYVLSGNIAPKAVQAIYIKDTPLTLTKTTSGTVYLLSSDLKTEIDSASYADMAENTSLVLIDNTWLQTYAITPNAFNVWQEFALCEDGYVRNLETGYCNKIQVTDVQTSCGDGKYRNPETNRCKTIETASSSLLIPCASNQVRNPETNRCRSITTASTLQPCAANQERNPTTNRCRTKAAMVEADFPVEAVATSTEATLGWWAFGGVGLLALSYAGWEWRSEVGQFIKKAASFIPSRG